MAREMKDSGIEWIGEIPEEWKTIAFWQAIERMATGLNPRDNFELTKEDTFYYVTIRNFKNGKLFLDDRCDRISPNAWQMIQERSQLKKGDILFASISEEPNAYILDDDPVNWNINESVFCIRINRKYYSPKFFYYHLTDYGYYSDLRMDATGSTFQSIKQNKLRLSRMTLPPLPEQRRIADFLDRKCAEIDRVVAETEKTIEEYKALKQSIITEAVTKGVRGKRPMKDSGIEWIGEIPEEWAVIAHKYVMHKEKNICEHYNGEDIISLSMNGVHVRDLDAGGKMPTTFDGYQYVNVDDLLMCLFDIDVTPRCVGIVRDAGVTSPAYSRFKVHDGYLNRYYDYLLRFIDDKKVFVHLAKNLRSSLTETDFGAIKTIVPPVQEQMEIAEYLDRKCVEVDCLVASKQRLLTELESYKKSVIYEYVTGKKEVPACQ